MEGMRRGKQKRGSAKKNTLIAGTDYLRKRVHGEAVVRRKLGETPRSEVSVLYSQRFPTLAFFFSKNSWRRRWRGGGGVEVRLRAEVFNAFVNLEDGRSRMITTNPPPVINTRSVDSAGHA